MRKMYQTEWQGINFTEFASLSSRNLPCDSFYDAFYSILFSRYHGFDALSEEWRVHKAKLAKFILRRTTVDARVLSVGCGLGYVEHEILQIARDQTDLHVQEIVSTALSWIRKEIRSENMHIGPIPDCLPKKHTFDVIYLSAVDYALSDYQLRDLFKTLQSYLKPHGELLILSASFLPMVSRWRVPLVFLKARLADILDWLNLRPRGQFWGWARTQQDYHQIIW
jgi:SAM-dependent methyltransferase